MSNEMDENIPPNLRVIRILEILADTGIAMTPTQIGQHANWPKQTTHRLCKSMIEAGLLEKHGSHLQPHIRAGRIGAGLASFSIRDTTCHQILRNIAIAIGETVNFARPEKPGMNYVDRVETNWPFRILLPVGTHVPFHCTASGKAYLASLPPARRKAMIESISLDASTEETHTTAESLSAELDLVRRRGYALDLEEFHLGMVAIAVPVRDHKGRFFAALAVHGPKQRFDQKVAVDSYGLLKESAAQISTVLFG